jgi:hypothetical protein
LSILLTSIASSSRDGCERRSDPFGLLVAPEGNRDEGQPIPVGGYTIRHPDAPLLGADLGNSEPI